MDSTSTLEEERAEPRSKRLLLIEDDRELSTVLVRIARRVCRSLEIDWVDEFSAAQDHIRLQHYDAILADLYLADGKRGHTLAQLHSDQRTDGCFALMSACPLDELLQVLPHSQIPILSKPFTTREYGEFVIGLLDRSSEKRSET